MFDVILLFATRSFLAGGTVVDAGGAKAAPEVAGMGAILREMLMLTFVAIAFVAWHIHSARVARTQKQNAKLAQANASIVVTDVSHSKVEPPKLTIPASAQAEGAVRLRRPSRSEVASDPLPPSAAQLAQCRAIEQQMIKLIDQREFTRALNMYRACERDGRDRGFLNEELFLSFVQSSIRVGKVDVVDRMHQAMKRNGVKPSLKFWQGSLKMLASRKHFNTCISMLDSFAQVPADKVVCSCLINAALEVGTPDVATSLLERYDESGLEAKDHVLHFRTFVATGNHKAAEALFRKLGAEASPLMLNMLLLVCVNASQPDRAAQLLFEAHEMEQEGMRLVDAVSYNTVIKGFSRMSAPEKCFECLRVMRSRGLEPDEVTFAALLNVCCASGSCNPGTVLPGKLMDLLLGCHGEHGHSVDVATSMLFVKGLVRANLLPSAIEVYDELQSRKAAPGADISVEACFDVTTLSMMIKACVEAHDLERALLLTADLRKAGGEPDDIIYTHLLEGCRHAGHHKLGKQLFAEMLAAGVAPSDYTLMTMLKLHGRCGAHSEAHALLEGWKALHGSKPSVIHFTCLMSGCLRTKSFELAWRAYELMCQSGVRPDQTMVATLLPGMVAAQYWDRVLTLAVLALSPPVALPVPEDALNKALGQMLAAGGSVRQAEQLQDMMRAAGIRITVPRARISLQQ